MATANDTIRAWTEKDAAEQRARVSPSKENLERASLAQKNYDRVIRESKSTKRNSRRSRGRD